MYADLRQTHNKYMIIAVERWVSPLDATTHLLHAIDTTVEGEFLQFFFSGPRVVPFLKTMMTPNHIAER
jgi:hypothetical protein